MHLLQFVNYYASIIYAAFLKGMSAGSPAGYDHHFGFRQEEDYEDGSDAFNDATQYAGQVELVRTLLPSKLKAEQGFVGECLQGDLLCKQSTEISLIPAPVNKLLSYQKPLMKHKAHATYKTWMGKSDHKQFLLPSTHVSKQTNGSTTVEALSSREGKRKCSSYGICNSRKIFWENSGKLLMLALITQVAAVQALQNSTQVDFVQEGNATDGFSMIPILSINQASFNRIPYNNSDHGDVNQYMEVNDAPRKEILLQFDTFNKDQPGLIPHLVQECRCGINCKFLNLQIIHPLILSTQTLSGSNGAQIGDISSIRLSNDEVIVCMRQGRQIIGYRYIASKNTWDHHWNELVFSQDGDYPLGRYPWLVTDKLIPNENIILLRHPSGIQFYKVDPAKPGLTLLTEDVKFHEGYSGSLLWGHFYPNTSYVGVMTREIQKRIKFYASTLKPNKPPLSPLRITISFPSWTAGEPDFFVTRLYHNDSEVIGLRTPWGLEFYQFNTDYLLVKVITTSQITKSKAAKDRLFFGDLTHQIYQDILYLNDSGLFVYQYNNSQEDYVLLHRHTGFTKRYGWLPDYADSIRLIDLNCDSFDDLIFTGPQGISGLSFDAITKSWKPLLHELSGAERYATVVGALPPMPPSLPYTCLFMQDTEGKLLWAKVMPAPISNATVPPPITKSTHTTIAPSSNGDAVVPEQIIRTDLPEKPILRWAEQWDDGFLKETVDPASGQVRLSIPLIDMFPLTGWRLQIVLSYNSQVRTSELLGIGWWLPLAQDYIFVDHQGSIYPEDAHYYLMAEGRPQLLKFIGTEGNVQHFQLADEGVQISYNSSAQHWIIEGRVEQTIYGKAISHGSAQDALKWSLVWPNWRGIGRDRAEQQPLITAWYLSRRVDKDNQRTLYYQYEKDSATIENGKTYDVALRLKTIHDGQYMKLNVDYAPKESSEYTTPNPVDNEGNIVFPITLAQSHYIQGYSLTSATYSQKLKFSYQVNDGERLLTAIEQPSISHTEQILQFSYQTVLDEPALKSCTLLPKETTVHFNYRSFTPPKSTIVNSYPIREKAKIVYGSDYAIMAYRDLHPTTGKVILRIMNRSMTQTMIDCSVDAALSCPSAESDIKNYAIQAYPDSFVVFTESSEKRALHLFHRHEKTWSTAPATYIFGKKALVRFSETIIAAAEPDEPSIMLFTRADNQSYWHEQTLILPRTITTLTLHNRLIVGYDDHQLWLFHHDAQSGWKKKWLDNQSNSIGPTLASFDLDPEARQQVVMDLNKKNLQMLKNCILYNTVQENNGLLSSHTNLFLLDAGYNIARKQSFKIERKNIYQITYESNNGNIVFHLGYVKEQGLFKI
ncbi:uncharacterized protein LOC124168679 [Ischnura elegans]|uniref:uncharacterized protein LOC124168679 n=1 Tax=Ischnura elegans TaxID=197161 RepID=UPI001ED874F4|nr:uncharacterized protein LOC124168679 [Ischnura elegans]